MTVAPNPVVLHEMYVLGVWTEISTRVPLKTIDKEYLYYNDEWRDGE
jgi:hypothetical protein